MNILETIIHNSGKSKTSIAKEVGWCRKTLYNNIERPHNMSVKDITALARSLRRSPRNIFSLILKTNK